MIEPSDPIQERGCEAADFGFMATNPDEILDSAFHMFRLRPNHFGKRQTEAEHIELWVVDRRVPVLFLPSVQGDRNDFGKVFLVSQTRKTKSTFEHGSHRRVVLPDEDVVYNVDNFLLVGNTLLVCVDTDGFEVGPVVPDGLRNSARRNGPCLRSDPSIISTVVNIPQNTSG